MLLQNRNSGGAIRKVVDFDVLRQELSDCIVEGPEERYQFTWPDKRKSILAANAPINRSKPEAMAFFLPNFLPIRPDGIAPIAVETANIVIIEVAWPLDLPRISAAKRAKKV